VGTLTYVSAQVTFAISPALRTFLARKILLADDSVTAQNMGRKILADAGYEVIPVNNGSAAIKKIAELKPDLVILDVYMPGYSGLEVCQRLKESQETARIPVLLSVGKLEPFKPEEAQRVRADAFIVKPFEASELLSALSKLEDKVVPRSEPSKPGRFARAIAAQEEAARAAKETKETSGEDNGWKNRIAFPHEKTEAEKKADSEEKTADDAAIYNQMNRDLRTVVDKSPAEATLVTGTPEVNVDDPATVPPNLLNDVTPEEVAAIAAAVAQMQMAAAVQGDLARPSSETSEVKPEAITENKIDAAVDAAEPTPAAQEPATPEKEVPATIAAGNENEGEVPAPRWKAVSVALDAEEASISLENEMRQAYAAFVAMEPVTSTATTSPEPAISPASALENISSPYASAEPIAESPIAALAVLESEPLTANAPENAATTAIAQSTVEDQATFSAVSEPEKLPEVAAVSNEPVAEVVSVPCELSHVEVPVETAATTAPVETISLPAQNNEPMQNYEPALTHEPAHIAEQTTPLMAEAEPTIAAQSSEVPTAEAEPEIAQAAAVGSYSTTGSPQIVHRAEHEVNPQSESEAVKSTAAAWASWRQIRDTNEMQSQPVAEPKSSEFESPKSTPEDSAVAAASSEHVPQALPTEPLAENTDELASIVDSVLADLRPKLMAEISRKMSQKK
jgi:twitching motility two-component system response regulator PilH